MCRTSLAVVLAVTAGSVVLSAAQPGEHADLNHDLHAAALNAWVVADLTAPSTLAPPAAAAEHLAQ